MSKFKVGDRVKIVVDWCDVAAEGDIVEVTELFNHRVSFKTKDGDQCDHPVNGFELATPSWDNLQVGDVFENDRGQQSKVLAVLPGVFLPSKWGDFIITGSDWLTVTLAKTKDWKLIGEEDEDTTELTLEEVAKKFKIPVDKLRIKD